MTGRRPILRASILSALPALLVMAVGGALLATDAVVPARALLIGGACALPFALGGAAVVAAFAQAPLPIALCAALAAFGLRILGAGMTLVLLHSLPQAGVAAAALVGALVAALAFEMYGLARSTIQEPVRA